jgi:hypothetical protein
MFINDRKAMEMLALTLGLASMRPSRADGVRRVGRGVSHSPLLQAEIAEKRKKNKAQRKARKKGR